MAAHSGGRGFAAFFIAALAMLAVLVAYKVWSNRLLFPAPMAMSLRLPDAPQLPPPAPMPNPQPVPAPLPTPG